jgi:hypothetical protein
MNRIQEHVIRGGPPRATTPEVTKGNDQGLTLNRATMTPARVHGSPQNGANPPHFPFTFLW